MTTSCSNIYAIYLYYILDRKAGQSTAAIAGATVANNLGAECFSKSQFREAIEHFTSAVGLDGANHMFYANRCYSHQQIKAWTHAITDAKKVSVS